MVRQKDRIGAILDSDASIYAQRINTAFQSLNDDMTAAGFPGQIDDPNSPTETPGKVWAHFQARLVQWDAFFPSTQGVIAGTFGIDDPTLTTFATVLTTYRDAYTRLTGKAPTVPVPVPPKPGENTPRVELGAGVGIGFGLVLVVGAIVAMRFLK